MSGWPPFNPGVVCWQVSGRSPMRILLVEDEKKLCELIERALKAERYAVDTAYDGLSGWELADSYDYDLVILDLMLPSLSGTEVLRRIRTKNQEVPILILTARDATEEKVRHFRSEEHTSEL